jgi:hypothetical protein
MTEMIRISPACARLIRFILEQVQYLHSREGVAPHHRWSSQVFFRRRHIRVKPKGGLPVQKVLKLPAGFLPRQNFRERMTVTHLLCIIYQGQLTFLLCIMCKDILRFCCVSSKSGLLPNTFQARTAFFQGSFQAIAAYFTAHFS